MSNEHNHGKLWQGFSISFFVFGTAIFLGTTSILAESIFSKGFILFVTGMLFVVGYLMIKGIFEKKQDCPKCQSNKGSWDN